MMLVALMKDCRTEDSETVCILTLMKDAVMRQRGDAHDGAAEKYCPDDSEMICMVARVKDFFTEDSGMMCMVALVKDAFLMTAR